MQLPEVEGQDAAEALGRERPVARQRLDHLGARERDDDVLPVLAVPPLKQPELVTHHGGALDVQGVEALPQQRVQRSEVELDRLPFE